MQQLVKNLPPVCINAGWPDTPQHKEAVEILKAVQKEIYKEVENSSDLKEIVLNMREVQGISTAYANILFEMYKHLKTKGCTLKLTSVLPHVKKNISPLIAMEDAPAETIAVATNATSSAAIIPPL